MARVIRSASSWLNCGLISRGDHMSVMYQHVQGRAKPPREVNPALAAELSELIVRAMAVDKTKRFQNMEELRAALQKFL